MASARRPLDEREHLALLEQQLAALRAEAGRLNRRLRNIRSAVHACEEGLAALQANVKARLEELDD